MGRKAGDRKRIDYKALVGVKFNMLTICETIKYPAKRTLAKCTCDCGVAWEGTAESVVSGNTKSCGCHKRRVLLEAVKTHGLTKHHLYSTWREMIRRCYSVKKKAYPYYGGRGIAVCDRWRIGDKKTHPFIFFLRDMFPSWVEGLSIDRIDNNLGYSPDNCKWSSRSQQSWNRRNVTFIYFDGEEIPLAEYCRRTNKHRSTIIRRMRKLGITLNEAALMQ
jgi:hypothetical protein